MGGIAGGLFAVFEGAGFLFFSILIGPKRGGARSLRTHRVVAGGILFMARLGCIAGFDLEDPEVAASGLLSAHCGCCNRSWIGLNSICDSTCLYRGNKRGGNGTVSAKKNDGGSELPKGLILIRAVFIATTVFGSADAAEVAQLRAWRDAQLLHSPVGRFVVSLYYAVSPSAADLIEYAHLKTPVRFLVRLFITFLHESEHG